MFNITQLDFSENILFIVVFRSLCKISNLGIPFVSEIILSTLYWTVQGGKEHSLYN